MYKLKDTFLKKGSYQILLTINIGTIIILFILFQEKNLTNLINAFFYIAILYTIVFLYLYILKATFFDGVIYGFRNFLNKVFTNKNSNDTETLPSENVNLQLFNLIKWQTVTLLGFLLLLQTIYFII